MLRIIAGKHKNRIIPTVKNAKYRPSTGKLREAIFSILTSGEFSDNQLFTNDSNILDLFSGTGSLAFEALSRGAGNITLVDINIDYLQVAQGFARLLGELEKTYLLNISALHLPRFAKVQSFTYDVIFIDPPYYNNLVPQTIEGLIENQWLKNNSILVVELAKTDDLLVNDFHSIKLIKERIYGDSKLLILRYSI